MEGLDVIAIQLSNRGEDWQWIVWLSSLPTALIDGSPTKLARRGNHRIFYVSIAIRTLNPPFIRARDQ